MPLYTKEQIEEANSISLVEYLQLRGEALKASGSEYKWIYRDGGGEHDSISIRENKWYDHKNGTGGYTVAFLQDFYGMRFTEAMRELLNETPQLHKRINKEAKPEPAKPFQLPEKASNMKNLFAYLIKKRFLSQEIVQFFVENKLLYQEKQYNNIVFVGMDENGVPREAHKKSPFDQHAGFKATVSGSDSRYSFCYRGDGARLYVFEGAVDLLSFLTLYPEQWQEQSYIALDGLSPKAMLHLLDGNKAITEINICTDFDPAGIEAYDKFRDLLLAKGYQSEQINCLYPDYKDWNEDLKAQNQVTPILPQFHPRMEGYKKMVKNLCRLNEKPGEPYMLWKLQYKEKKGFLLRAMMKEINALSGADCKDIETIKAMRGCMARTADCAITALCELQSKADSSVHLLTFYNQIAGELKKQYKPYQDKSKITKRIQELNKEMALLNKAIQGREDSLFLYLQNIADMAIRLKVYVDTDYEQDMERQLSIQKKEAEVEETAPTMQMG